MSSSRGLPRGCIDRGALRHGRHSEVRLALWLLVSPLRVLRCARWGWRHSAGRGTPQGKDKGPVLETVLGRVLPAIFTETYALLASW